MKISLVVAYGRNFAIGKDNQLIWHLADDMAFFKELTTNHTVLMGKNTYYSIPKRFRPLPNRMNLVISSQKHEENHPNLMWFESLDKGIEWTRQQNIDELFIIGGASIYNQILPLATDIYATEVDVSPEADAFFPQFDHTLFENQPISSHLKDAQNDYEFKIIHYKRL